MFLSRTLHGLRVARAWVSGDTRQRIDEWLQRGNRILAERFQADILGNLKAYTAVVEYLADWTIPVSAGLLFHAGRRLAVAKVSNTEPQAVPGGLRIAWLSDLHVAAMNDPAPGKFNPLERHASKFMHINGTALTQHFQLNNLNVIINRLLDLKPGHILVTGDLTNYAQESQFQSARDQFIQLQASLSGKAGTQGLDPGMWTILPGNHDIATDRSLGNSTKPNLGLFFQYFGSLYETANNYEAVFPVRRLLKGAHEKSSVRLIGLDSTRNDPVWRVGINARGEVDAGQTERLNRLLSVKHSPGMTLVALHHHPMVIPNFVSALEDYFLSLRERDGRKLIQICANNDVRAILHGHFHAFSLLSTAAPGEQGKMTVVGSPAGTMTVAKASIEFLEFREAERETPDGMQVGLALYRQRFSEQEIWYETFTGVFLEAS